MLRITCWSAGLLILIASALPAQDTGRGPGRPTKQATAIRIDRGAIRVDGSLDDDAWQHAPPLLDFVQAEPDEGAPPTQRMEVRFAYDGAALYVGARMFSADRSAIQAPLARRDSASDQSEHVRISFDTFLDHRTAYTFGVSASGVRFDAFYATDDQNAPDPGFNPVWEVQTRRDAEGWTAELWIPFSQLRFNPRDEQTWGLNVKRFTPQLKEQVYWTLISRTERAWASRFGELRGISGVHPTKRLELLPVLGGSSTLTANRNLANPFDDGRNLSSRVGGDLKMGLGPSLTLDATVNPDFGQVEADPSEVNLTAFATRFPERRPFFTEGAGLLTINHSNAFYSRRIGRPPTGPATGDFIDYPQTNRILGAAKVTGRLSGGTSIGVLGAVTNQEFARTAVIGVPAVQQIRVAPRTAFGVTKVQQELGNGSTASVLLATVHRDFAGADPLEALLSHNAFVIGGDAVLRFRRGQYQLKPSFVTSYVEGSAAAIERIQRSSTHYLQRPDLTYNRLDPTRTSLLGVSPSVDFDRTGGSHWLFGTHAKLDFPTFENNDLALLNAADGIEQNAYLTYRETRPGPVFRTYAIKLAQSNEWNFGMDRQKGALQPSLTVTWANFWTSSILFSQDFRTTNAGLARGGPLVGTPRGWTTTFTFASPSNAQTRWSGRGTASHNEMNGSNLSVTSTFAFRPGPRWEFSVAPTYTRNTDAQQYVTTLGGGRPETFGNRYIFAYIERRTLSAQLRAALTLVPDLTIDLYAEPFAASGRYYDYGEMLAPGSRERVTYGASGTTIALQPDGRRAVTAGTSTFTLANADFDVRSLRSNFVLRWEWRPGSTMYLVWQQNRQSSGTTVSRIGPGALLSSLTEPGTNILLFKASFWIPVR